MSTIAIIAGGGSVTLHDVERLARAKFDRRCQVVAVNNAAYVAWWADILYAADSKWWRQHIERIQHFKGLRVTSGDALPVQWNVTRVLKTGVSGYDAKHGNVRGNNSGYEALHYALQHAPVRVLLFGYDMAWPHWHEGHPNEPECDYGRVMAPHFDALRAAAKEQCTEVINCSARSVLPQFERRKFCEVSL